MPGVVAAVLATAAFAVHLAARHSIHVVVERGLLPRWDLAAHLWHGWFDYYLLTSGRIPHVLWDLWLQGYWPPLLSLWQVPFYLLLGGELSAGSWSSAAAFTFVGVLGALILWQQWAHRSLLPAAIFIALLTSSPFLLAYATITMTEMAGATAQLLVVFAYERYRARPTGRRATLIAISLTILFFTKYNYFLLLAAPLVVHEWLERTAGWTLQRRARAVWASARRVLTSPMGVLVVAYAVALVAVLASGGFEFRILGRRVSVRGIGNSGHIVLYIAFARIAYLYWRGRIDWEALGAADPRIPALIVWFVVPVAVWMASPYPNHIRDFFNLVVNRPVGEPTVEAGLASYFAALRDGYFFSPWVLGVVAGAFVVAAVRYRAQPALMKFLVVAVAFQAAVIALHQTRLPRFLLLTVVLLCLAAAGEVGRWLSALRGGVAIGAALAPAVLACGIAGTMRMVEEERFRALALEEYIDSPALREALGVIRRELSPDDRLLVIGETDVLSPALVRWQLGPPSGVPSLPHRIAGEGRLDPELATCVLLVASPGSMAPLSVGGFEPSRVRAVMEAIGRGDLIERHRFALTDLGVSLWFYVRPPRRASAP